MQNVEVARETRLWIKEIITPAIIITLLIVSNPKVQSAVKNGTQKLSTSIANIFRKA